MLCTCLALIPGYFSTVITFCPLPNQKPNGGVTVALKMASPLVMADKDKVKKAKIELQLILWESVVGRKSDSRKKVLDLFADEKYFNQNESLLDFTFQQANECKELSRSSRLTVQEGFKYRKYSPLMVAVEEDDYDLAEELLKAKASVAFKNKVGK